MISHGSGGAARVADSVEGSPQHREEPSALETLVLAEKAMGHSDLEVAAKLMLAEWTVRSIVRKQCRDSSTASRLHMRRRPATI